MKMKAISQYDFLLLPVRLKRTIRAFFVVVIVCFLREINYKNTPMLLTMQNGQQM